MVAVVVVAAYLAVVGPESVAEGSQGIEGAVAEEVGKDVGVVAEEERFVAAEVKRERVLDASGAVQALAGRSSRRRDP